jgi:hypothetical protein
LTGQERADLLAFLQSLTGNMPPNVGPPSAAKKEVKQGRSTTLP